MKLTKEQILAFYLPHKLQMKCDGGIFHPNNNERPIIKGADATLTPDLYADICNRTYNSIGTFTPLLRPLSSLTIEQEINGERSVPIKRMFENVIPFPEHILDDLINRPLLCRFAHVHQLIKWHFNVFDLPEDEYVDINSLKK